MAQAIGDRAGLELPPLAVHAVLVTRRANRLYEQSHGLIVPGFDSPLSARFAPAKARWPTWGDHAADSSSSQGRPLVCSSLDSVAGVSRFLPDRNSGAR